MSKDDIFSVPYFPVFSPDTGKCLPEKTPYLDTFCVVKMTHFNISQRRDNKHRFT